MNQYDIPPDYLTEQARIAQRQKLAQALMMKGLEPQPGGEMVSGHYVARGPLGAIADVAKVWLAQKADEKASEDQRKLAERYGQEMGADMAGVRAALTGKPAQSTPNFVMQVDEATGQPAEAMSSEVPANPAEAVTRALASRFGEVRKYGAELEKQQAEFRKAGLTGAARNATPESVAAAATSGDLSQIRGPRFGDVRTLAQGPNGPIIGQREIFSGEVKFAPGGGTTVNLAGENAAEKLAVQQIGGQAEQLRQKTLPLIESLQTQSRLMAEGAKTGMVQPELELVKNFFTSLTGVEVDPTQPITQSLRSEMKNAVLKDIGSLGAQISDADRKFIENAFSNERMGADAVHEVNAIRLKYAMQSIERHNAFVDSQRAAGVAAQNPKLLDAQKVQAPELQVDAKTAVYFIKHTQGLSTQQAARMVEKMNRDKNQATDIRVDPKTKDTYISWNGGFNWYKMPPNTQGALLGRDPVTNE